MDKLRVVLFAVSCPFVRIIKFKENVYEHWSHKITCWSVSRLLASLAHNLPVYSKHGVGRKVELTVKAPEKFPFPSKNLLGFGRVFYKTDIDRRLFPPHSARLFQTFDTKLDRYFDCLLRLKASNLSPKRKKEKNTPPPPSPQQQQSMLDMRKRTFLYLHKSLKFVGFA